MLRIVMDIINHNKSLGIIKHPEIVEYLENYPNLSKLPSHEIEYISYKFVPTEGNEYAHHDTILKHIIILSNLLPQDVITEIEGYKKHPWTASFNRLDEISEMILEKIN